MHPGELFIADDEERKATRGKMTSRDAYWRFVRRVTLRGTLERPESSQEEKKNTARKDGKEEEDTRGQTKPDKALPVSRQ